MNTSWLRVGAVQFLRFSRQWRNNDRHSVKCSLHAIHGIFLPFLFDWSFCFRLSVPATLGQVGIGVVHDISGHVRNSYICCLENGRTCQSIRQYGARHVMSVVS